VHIELLTIGDELLNGVVADTNAAWLAERLWACGVKVSRCTTVPDDIEQLTTALRSIGRRADVCVCTGGLGPTPDDITVDALAKAAEVDIAFDASVWAKIQERYGKRSPPECNRRQARVPVGARPLHSTVGTSPGLELTIGRCRVLAVPGVPREMKWHFENHLQALLHLEDRDASQGRHLRFAGIGESTLAQRIEAAQLPDNVEIAYLTRMPENHIRLRSDDPSALAKAAQQVIEVAPDSFVGEGQCGLVESLLAVLEQKGLTIGTAESCTGGLIGGAITAVPGSSSVFLGGIISYSNPIKRDVLGVSQDILDGEGAVSEACAEAMAQGARRALECDIAVSVTGIAGPGGARPGKPVGTVCFGWAGAGLDGTDRRVFRGDRDRVRVQALGYALDRVRRGLCD